MNKIIQFVSDYQERAVKLKKGFEKTEKNTWTIETVVEELNVQLGHFCTIVLKNSEKLDSRIIDIACENGRKIDNVEDELADVFLQTLVLIDRLGLNAKMLACDYYEKFIDAEKICISDEQLVVACSSILGQITEAIMKIENKRFPMKRANFSSEKDFVYDRFGALIYILNMYIEKYDIDMFRAFDLMEEDATKFLNNYKIN